MIKDKEEVKAILIERMEMLKEKEPHAKLTIKAYEEVLTDIAADPDLESERERITALNTLRILFVDFNVKYGKELTNAGFGCFINDGIYQINKAIEELKHTIDFWEKDKK
jgi:hypothetical protein